MLCLCGQVCTSGRLDAHRAQKRMSDPPKLKLKSLHECCEANPGLLQEWQVLLSSPIWSSFILLKMCYFRQFIIMAEHWLCTHSLRAVLSFLLVSLITCLVAELNQLCAIYVLCTAMPLCYLVYVKLTQTRVILKEGTSTEKMLIPDWSLGKPGKHLHPLDWLMWEGPAHCWLCHP